MPNIALPPRPASLWGSCPEPQLSCGNSDDFVWLNAMPGAGLSRAVVHFGRHYYIHFRRQISGDYFQRQRQRQPETAVKVKVGQRVVAMSI